MNIDERLDRLTERHEALTGHIELLTADVMQLKDRTDELAIKMDTLSVNADKQQKTMGDLMLAVSSLVELSRATSASIVSKADSKVRSILDV